MITAAEFDEFCASLPAAHQVLQWDSNVWKIGGKVFAIGGNWGNDGFGITFKCSRISFEMLKAEAGICPAPYLASRGFPWLKVSSSQKLNEQELKDFIADSYRLALAGLTKKARTELGL